MPSRVRRIYYKFRQELLDDEPLCHNCQSEHTSQDPLHYHHLIPQCLLSDYEKGYRCTQGILLCRRCRPTEVAKQRQEFRRLDDNGNRIYPDDPFLNPYHTLYMSKELREELISIWMREVQPPFKRWLDQKPLSFVRP